MTSFFVGDKTKPQFLVEVSSKTKDIDIYKPDKVSKNEEIFDKNYLGETVLSEKYDTILFTKKVSPYKKYKYTPEMIIKIKDKYILVSEKISKIKQK
jgi:hypothetical protein